MFIKTVWLLIGWFLWFALFYYIFYKMICKFNGKLKEVNLRELATELMGVYEELTKAGL